MIVLHSKIHIKKQQVSYTTMSVLLSKQVDVKKIKYSEVKVLQSGAKSVYLSHDGCKLMVQTPVLNLPYGVNDSTTFNAKFKKDIKTKKDDVDEAKKYDITVSFKGMQENPKIKAFHDKLREIEEKIVDDAFTNRQLWFKNNYNNNRDVVLSMFTPMVKMDKDKETGEVVNKYPPTFKVKIPYDAKEDKFGFDAYDMDNNEIDFASIVNNLKGGKAQLIIQLTGIWISAGMFGCSWKVVSAKFQQSNISKVTFLQDSDNEKDEDDDEDDEEDDEISVDDEVLKKKPVKEEVPVEEEDEDNDEDENDKDEEEDEEEAEEEEVQKEPTPPPSPPPAKTVTKKAVKKVAK
jgi:hypothetical protein